MIETESRSREGRFQSCIPTRFHWEPPLARPLRDRAALLTQEGVSLYLKPVPNFKLDHYRILKSDESCIANPKSRNLKFRICNAGLVRFQNSQI